MPNKAIAAAGGGGVAGAFVTLILAVFWKDATPDIAASLTTVVSAAFSGLSAYLVPHEG